MATTQQVRAWIAQAEADLRASRVEAEGVRECHRRYWIQQSYEKAIKAFALMRWKASPEEEREFTRVFLLKHSPLKSVSQAKTPVSKALHLLVREVERFVNGLDNSSVLKRIDATTPTGDPSEVSYRYPFLVDGAYEAPATYQSWDGYQGDMTAVAAAVERLLKAVRAEAIVSLRRPK